MLRSAFAVIEALQSYQDPNNFEKALTPHMDTTKEWRLVSA
jgi:hypothetical protein